MSSLRRALQRRLLGGLLAVLVVCEVGIYLLVRRLLTSSLDASLDASVSMLAGLVKEEAGEGMELDLSETPLPDFERTVDPQYFQVWLENGQVFARSASLGGRDLPRAEGQAHEDLVLPDGRRGRAAWLSFPVRMEPKNGVTLPSRSRASLAVARDRAPLDQALGGVVWALAAMGVALLGAVPLVVTRGVRRGLRPLAQVADEAARMDARALVADGSDAPARFSVAELPEELRPIGVRLNELLDRLAATFERERRFSADVAHELRTPVAELRNMAEVALRYPDDARPFDDVLGVAIQMESLVTTLLALARCEAGRQPVSVEPVDVGRALADAWAPLEATARGKALQVAPAPDAGVVVQTDRFLLGAIVGNLLSNAVAYTPPGGQLSWQCSPGEIAVVNSNRSLTAEDLIHAFEPFWRKDAARSDGLHAGLGLSLAQAYARLLGAELRLEVGVGTVTARLVFGDAR
jgi:signal transduction histidine kinase